MATQKFCIGCGAPVSWRRHNPPYCDEKDCQKQKKRIMDSVTNKNGIEDNERTGTT